jgi:demethylmenaquinone methyltransferase/2-methoxy-6-polyprenyl-1,4-benzoquinol methylase
MKKQNGLIGIETKEQQVQKIFNKIARKYDLINSIISFGCHNYWRYFMMTLSNFRAGDNILDLCCGTGMITQAIAKRVSPQGQVIGVDFSEQMLAVAEIRLAHFKYRRNIQFILGDAMALPFPDNSFDGVTIGYGLRNVNDLRLVLKETYRVIKPGRKVISLEMGKPSWPIFKDLYYLYLDKLMPYIGGVLSHDRLSYQYLHDSIIAFPHQKEITIIYDELNFKNPRCYELTGGIVVIHTGIK